MKILRDARHHSRLIKALLLREVTTRFGREGGGFLWIIAEPMVFCVGVLILWGLLKPEYEHGIKIGPFVMTGYMCLMLLRHAIGTSMGAIPANIGLLYHRQITVLHVVFTRNLTEFFGVSVAFTVLYVAFLVLGEVEMPTNWILLIGGWLLTAWVGFSVAVFMASLAIRFEVLERVVPVISYILIPLSGCFQMAAWVPENLREMYLLVPIPHGVEMVRGAVFGEFVHVYYNVGYAFAWGAALTFAALVLMSDAKDRVLID